MRIGGKFNGTDATVYLCIGFIPDFVKVWNLEGTQRIVLEWNKYMMGTLEVVEGIMITGATQTAAAAVKGGGIRQFFGNTVLTTADVGTTTYGHADNIYLTLDSKDYRYVTADSPHGVGDAIAATIDTWTLGSSSNFTGNFNASVTGGYIGEGSSICIDGRWYGIVALAAGYGSAANAVTLSSSVASGKVQAISGMYTMRSLLAGETTKAGFVITNTTVNVANAICIYEAGTYDR